MEWREYISTLLDEKSSLDGITLSFGENGDHVGIPPIIKASVKMLDSMMEHQGKFNILVFPERIQSIFIFTLAKLLQNIFEGRIESNYDPEQFQPGDKLRLGTAVVEFMCIEEEHGKKHMWIHLADLNVRAPIELFPLFQKTTAKKLSKHSKYQEAKDDAEKHLEGTDSREQFLSLLSDYRTHMSSSVVNMTSVINAKELIASCRLCEKKLAELILVGQTDCEGNIKNTGVGQAGGTPAIVLASDLYAVAAMAEKGHPIQSIIIDSSNASALLKQIDALDQLMRLGVPVTCLTDTVNSFDLQSLLDRGFNLWRWDELNITDRLYDATPLISDKKARRCANQKIEYLQADGLEISTAIHKLSLHRGDGDRMSAQVMKLYGRLSSLAFLALREIVPFSNQLLEKARADLEECEQLLAGEKVFLPPGTFEDYNQVISCLKTVFVRNYTLQKYEVLKEKLQQKRYRQVYIVVPERSDKNQTLEYWQSWCRRRMLGTQISVLYPAEYYPLQGEAGSATIVVGWLKHAIMRKILFSFNTEEYLVLLYDYEKRWQKSRTARWRAALNNSQNREAIERSFSRDNMRISTTRFEVPAYTAEAVTEEDELAEIETVLQENKYRRYVTNGELRSAHEAVEAIPVNFVGGYLAFYRTKHKIISASDIIINDGEKISLVLPGTLNLGDFVVIREADRDLIREMADGILTQSGKADLREIAGKWKEALEIELLFHTPEEIHQNLKNAGCIRSFATVNNWLSDDDTIAPQTKQDLECIAKMTGSSVLEEMMDQIYDAATTVRTAHMQAGKLLSQLLRNRIGEALKEYGDIDPFNIWEPIEMTVEGVGTVRVLKIIDIGAPVTVELSDTNRLLDEE